VSTQLQLINIIIINTVVIYDEDKKKEEFGRVFGWGKENSLNPDSCFKDLLKL
jgi:hypothetical protein